MKKIKLKFKGEMKMSENNNVRLGLIELYKNKVKFLGFTQKDLDEKYNSKFLSQEEYDILTNFYGEYLKEQN